MASNNNDAGMLWEEEKKEWDVKKTVILTLLGLLAIPFAFHGAFATKLLVQIIVALFLIAIALCALPGKWLRLVWMIGIVLVFVAFKRGLVDSLLAACLILLLASLAIIQTLPPRWRRFPISLSILIFFAILFGVWIYRFINTQGGFNFTYTPQAAGGYIMEVTGRFSGRKARAPFTVKPKESLTPAELANLLQEPVLAELPPSPAKLKVSPSEGEVGTTFNFTGSGYEVGESVTAQVWRSQADGTPVQEHLSFEKELVAEMRFLKFLLEGQAARIIFSGLVGLLGALLVIGIPLLIVLWPSSEYVLALHEVDGIKRWDALRLLWSLVMGTQLPWQVVEDGEVKQTKPEGILDKIGGPGVVVIKPGNAVVFERKGKVTRIEGPGVVLTKRFEKAKHVIDLRPQWATVKAENVLTKDRVPLTIELGVGYRIELKKDTDERLESVLETDGEAFTREIGEVYRVYEETVRKAAYNVTAAGWQTTTREAAKTFLRDIVATCNFDDIFVLNGTELEENKRAIYKIEEAVKKKLAKAAVNWGVKITTIDIENIEMPKEAKEQLLAWWEAEWKRRIAIKEARTERRALIERAEGRALAVEKFEKIKAEARQKMINQLLNAINVIIKGAPDITIRFISVIEQLSRRIVTEDIIASRYMEVLEAIAESNGQKIFILGEDRRFLEGREDALRRLLETGALRPLIPSGGDETNNSDAEDSVGE